MKTEWKPDIEYMKGDVVIVYSKTYVCLINHKSRVFANDYFDKSLWKEQS